LGKFDFFEKLENTKPPLSPLSSHFGILAKGRGSSATGFNGRRRLPGSKCRSSLGSHP
jgi:hypothetical protein